MNLGRLLGLLGWSSCLASECFDRVCFGLLCENLYVFCMSVIFVGISCFWFLCVCLWNVLLYLHDARDDDACDRCLWGG